MLQTFDRTNDHGEFEEVFSTHAIISIPKFIMDKSRDSFKSDIIEAVETYYERFQERLPYEIRLEDGSEYVKCPIRMKI